MSRGGRGGFAMRGGKQRIGGQEVSWDYDPDLVIENKPQDDFPVPSSHIAPHGPAGHDADDVRLCRRC